MKNAKSKFASAAVAKSPNRTRLMEIQNSSQKWQFLDRDERGLIAGGKRVTPAQALRWYATKAVSPNASTFTSNGEELATFLLECADLMDGKAVAA